MKSADLGSAFPQPGVHVSYKRISAAAGLICAATVLGWYLLSADSRRSDRLLSDGRDAFIHTDFAAEEQTGRQLRHQRSQSASVRFKMARTLTQRGKVDDALELLELIPDDDRQYGYSARVAAGELFLYQKNQLWPAAKSFHRALQIDPHRCQIHERLSYIYGIADLTWRAVPHRVALLCGNQFNSVHLLVLAAGTAGKERSAAVQRFYDADQKDPLAVCGMAALAVKENRTDDALSLLGPLLDHHVDWPEPQAWYGGLLLQERDYSGVEKWLSSLPQETTAHPDIWFVRGRLAELQQDPRGSVRCFAEAVRAEPNHKAANFQLAQALLVIGESERAQPFLRRARLLEELLGTVRALPPEERSRMSDVQNSGDPIRRASEITADLGLTWETWGWNRLLSTSNPSAWPRSRMPSPRNSFDGSTPLDTILQAYSAARNGDAAAIRPDWDLADYPLPKADVLEPVFQPDPGSSTARSEIRFDNAAADVGLDWVYMNGSRRGSAGEHIYNSTGGGVGAFDYDLDHWPDLYFTQGCSWPPQPDQSLHLDRMYRNLGGEQFEDVTADTRLFENGFGQGLAVGDIDNDGFPDLYVGNIGHNRLFHNNGDGTFTEIAGAAGVDGDEWTTSCVIADLNGDTWPDIYAVSYVEDDENFVQPCTNKDGSTRLCTPYEYDAAMDRLYLSLGDGQFRDVSSEAGIQVPNGKGLGVVAADFNHTGRTDLFVANDTVPNFFFLNQTAQPGDIPSFDEQSFMTGLAVDAKGLSQACMGIAYGDANGDGQFDLFVTNFRDESNTLYLQQPGFLFSDASRTADLYEPSYAQLGFGTQFIDGDLDGHPDLVVTNGHVGDLTHTGAPYQMPTQMFQNVGSGRFTELEAEQLGEFFQQLHLGRGLARLDWNRDGLDDVAVSHLEEQVALLTNRTETTNQFVAFRLRGVKSSRDAVGATVNVTCGGRTMTGQITSGDGYLARNEQRLNFGLGQSASMDKVEIHWPSGLIQTVQDVPVQTEVLVIEGAADPIVLMKTGWD